MRQKKLKELERLINQKKEKIIVNGKIVVVLKDVKTGEKKIIEGKNILCGSGQGMAYYAQMGAGQSSPTYDFTTGGCKLGTGTTTPTAADTDIETYITNSYKAISSGYPLANDGDTDNTGKGPNVVTWKYFWDTTEVNVANINELAICLDIDVPPEAILNHAHFDSTFTKVNTQTLTVFVNHGINNP